MLSLQGIITLLLAALVVLGQVFILAIIVQSFSKKGRERILQLFPPAKSLTLAFLVALVSVIGTLFYSEIIGFAVCKLCWFQRIFLYPQVLILAVALYLKDAKVAYYTIPLALLGIFFSFFHFLVQATEGGISCGSAGASCSKIYLSTFGYISFPVMSATAFLLIITLSLLALFGSRKMMNTPH